jgi:lipopolysaccharide transport system permease protein
MSRSGQAQLRDHVTVDSNTAAAGRPPAVEARTVRVQRTRGWPSLRLREIWTYRELLYFFTWRDVKVRYKQTALGAAWAILQPLATMLVFTLVFGRLAGIPSEGVPYALFAYSGLVLWTFFSTGLVQAANSLVVSANLVTKVYFPRLLVPTASIGAAVLDVVLASSVLVLLMAGYGVAPPAQVLLAPLFVALAAATALGAGFWLSALNVQFRDVKYTLTFLTQLWLFATPIAYPSTLLDEPWRTLYALNPLVGAVEGFRWATLGADVAPGSMIAVSTAVATALLVSGAFYFRRMERTFADVI